MEVREKLGDEPVFSFFEEICAIPHGSRNERALSDHIVAFAKQRGLYCRQDAAYNVIIKKPASAGYEAAPAVILQGHIDMVCEKNADTIHDFETDPLEVYIDGDEIKARGTTLGADDGIAVAYMLALLDDAAAEHPPLECVFTTEEEIGMGGAAALDLSDLEGRRLINLDTEEEGQLMVSCCGGRRVQVSLPTEWEAKAADAQTYTLAIRGLKGGHSGSEIHLQRANANVLLGRVLQALREEVPYALAAVNGGNMDNAICREAEAVLCLSAQDAAKAQEVLRGMQLCFEKEYRDRESGILLTMEPLADAPQVLTEKTRDHLIALLLLLPYGVQTMDTSMEGLVESSNNIGVMKTEAAQIVIDNAVRGAVESRKEAICKRIEILSELCGAEATGAHDYPGWQYDPASKLLEECKAVWLEMFGTAPQVVAIHAGLECGLFAQKIPGLDLISFGPEMHDVHTPQERLSISSTLRVWAYLRAVLKKLK